MNRKQQFLAAVQILAPQDQFIFDAAQRIPEAKLPEIPGGAALEFVAALAKLKERLHCPSKPTAALRTQDDDEPQPWLVVPSKQHDNVVKVSPVSNPISVPQGLRIKCAESLLNQGDPVRALELLEKLPARARRHPWAARVRRSAACAARRMLEATIQE
jgi:hypothetical protein